MFCCGSNASVNEDESTSLLTQIPTHQSTSSHQESHVLMNKKKVRSSSISPHLCFSAMVIGINALALGYDVGCMNDALTLMKTQFQLSSTEEEVIDGMLNLLAAVGALFGAKISDGSLGRRGCLGTSALCYLLGISLSATAMTWIQIAMGRALCGLGVGFSICCSGLYLSEISPRHLRGSISGLYDFFIDIGILLGALVGYMIQSASSSSSFVLFGFNNASKWRVMLGFGGLMPLIVLLCLPFLLESPRWLHANGYEAKAQENLRLLFGSTYLHPNVNISHTGHDDDVSGHGAVGDVMLCDVVNSEEEEESEANIGGLLEEEEVQQCLKEMKEQNLNSQKNASWHDFFRELFGYNFGEVINLKEESLSLEEEANHETAIQCEEAVLGSSTMNITTQPTSPSPTTPLPTSSNDDINSEIDINSLSFRLMLVLCLGCLQQATGSEGVLYYCHEFLKSSGMLSTKAQSHSFILIVMCKLMGGIFPLLYADKYGRMLFYKVSTVGSMVVLIALSFICYFDEQRSASPKQHSQYLRIEIAFMGLFLFFFSFGVGTLLWVVVPELLPFRWRARAISAVVFLNRVTSATVTLTALTLINAITTAGFFGVYVFFAILSVYVSFNVLTETAGRSLES